MRIGRVITVIQAAPLVLSERAPVDVPESRALRDHLPEPELLEADAARCRPRELTS